MFLTALSNLTMSVYKLPTVGEQFYRPAYWDSELKRLMPSRVPQGEAEIPGGWKCQRLGFCLEFDYGDVRRIKIFGFTDGGALNDHTRWYYSRVFTGLTDKGASDPKLAANASLREWTDFGPTPQCPSTVVVLTEKSIPRKIQADDVMSQVYPPDRYPGERIVFDAGGVFGVWGGPVQYATDQFIDFGKYFPEIVAEVQQEGNCSNIEQFAGECAAYFDDPEKIAIILNTDPEYFTISGLDKQGMDIALTLDPSVDSEPATNALPWDTVDDHTQLASYLFQVLNHPCPEKITYEITPDAVRMRRQEGITDCPYEHEILPVVSQYGVFDKITAVIDPVRVSYLSIATPDGSNKQYTYPTYAMGRVSSLIYPQTAKQDFDDVQKIMIDAYFVSILDQFTDKE